MQETDIAPSQVAQLQKLAKQYPSGEMICMEGEPTQDLMLMLRGSVEVIKGKEVINTIRGQNVFLGHLAFFAAQRRTASLRAKTRCEIVRVREDKVVALLSAMPSLSVKLIRDIAEMFLQKEEQVSRFQKYGGGVRDAMKTQGIAEILESFLPALVASATCGMSREHQLEILLSFLDALSPKLQFAERGVSRSSVPTDVTNPKVRSAIEEGIMELIRMKSNHDDMPTDVATRGTESQEVFGELLTSLEQSIDNLQGVRVSLGVESQLKKISKLAPRLSVSRQREEYLGSLKLIQQMSEEVETLHRFAFAQRNDTAVRDEADAVKMTLDQLKELLEKVVHLDRETALRKQLLTYFKFEI